MTFDDFQEQTKQTAIYPGVGMVIGVAYATLGLNGEAGEVAEQIKKAFRDDKGSITPERREKIRKELGDVLWYAAAVARECDLSLSDVAAANIEKLLDRKQRGVLNGSGSER